MPHDAVPSQIHNSNYPPQHQPDFSTEPAVSHVLGNEKLDLGDQKAYIWLLFSLSLVLSSSLFNHEDFNELQIRAYQLRERNTRTELGSPNSNVDVAPHQTSRWKILRSVDATASS